MEEKSFRKRSVALKWRQDLPWTDVEKFYVGGEDIMAPAINPFTYRIDMGDKASNAYDMNEETEGIFDSPHHQQSIEMK